MVAIYWPSPILVSRDQEPRVWNFIYSSWVSMYKRFDATKIGPPMEHDAIHSRGWPTVLITWREHMTWWRGCMPGWTEAWWTDSYDAIMNRDWNIRLVFQAAPRKLSRRIFSYIVVWTETPLSEPPPSPNETWASPPPTSAVFSDQQWCRVHPPAEKWLAKSPPTSPGPSLPI